MSGLREERCAGTVLAMKIARLFDQERARSQARLLLRQAGLRWD